MLQVLMQYDLAAKKGFIALKAEVDKLDIAKLINVPVSFKFKAVNGNVDFPTQFYLGIHLTG